MTTYLGKSCSFCLPRVPFVNCRQFMYLVISLLVLRAGYGIWLYQFLIIAYLFYFKKNPNVVHPTHISKITIFSERPKERTLRQYNFVNSFNVKTGFKCYKLLQGTTCVCKMQNIEQTFVLHAFKSDNNLGYFLSSIQY